MGAVEEEVEGEEDRAVVDLIMEVDLATVVDLTMVENPTMEVNQVLQSLVYKMIKPLVIDIFFNH